MINIRTMTVEDYDGVYNLWYHTPGMCLNPFDESKAGIEKYIKRNPNTSFVAEDDGKIVGVVMAGHDGRRGYIYHAAVSPSYRNSGIGKNLVEYVMSALEKEGINRVALVAFKDNEIGNGFWEKVGFTAREDLVYRNKNIRELNEFNT